MKFFPFVFKNLLRKKTRSLLTIGVDPPAAPRHLHPRDAPARRSSAIRRAAGGCSASSCGTRSRSRTGSSRPTCRRSAQLPGVTDVVRMNWFGGAYIDQSAGEHVRPLLDVGRRDAPRRSSTRRRSSQGSAEDWISRPERRSSSGELLMKKYGWKLGQKITLKGDIYPVNLELTIRAIFKGPDETGVYFHHQYIEEALPRVKGFVGLVLDQGRLRSRPSSGSRTRSTRCSRTPTVPTRTETEKEFQNGFVSMLGNVKLLVDLHRHRHRLRHPPHRGEHDGDGGPRAGHRDRRPPDARLPEGDDPRADPRRERPPLALRRARSALGLFVVALPRLPAGSPLLADGRLRRRACGSSPRSSPRAFVVTRPRRPPRRPRARRSAPPSAPSPTASGRSAEGGPRCSASR